MTTHSDKRARLIDGAEAVFHRKGFGGTTLADVAEESGVPLGNIYYYFRTRDALAKAVIDRRIDEVEAMIASAERVEEPARRLAAFLQHSVKQADGLSRFGCPYGCLSQEFARMGGPLAERSAALLGRQREWMTDQFRAMGYSLAEARRLGLELLSAAQGAIVVALSLSDPRIIRTRFGELTEWVGQLADQAAGTPTSARA